MIYYKHDRTKEKQSWHKWFAWYPVTISRTPDGDERKVWLQSVLRCGISYYNLVTGWHWSWKYKEMI